MVQARSSAEIKQAWATLRLHKGEEVDWKAAAKAFDDWTLVLSGESTQQFWSLHGGPLNDAERQNPHGIHLCFLCSVSDSVRWGTYEHMYSLMLHKNRFTSMQQQVATIAELRSFTSIFTLNVGSAHKLMQLLAKARWQMVSDPAVDKGVWSSPGR